MRKFRKISKDEALKHIAGEFGHEDAVDIAAEETDEFILKMGTGIKHYTGQHYSKVLERIPDYSSLK